MELKLKPTGLNVGVAEEKTDFQRLPWDVGPSLVTGARWSGAS